MGEAFGEELTDQPGEAGLERVADIARRLAEADGMDETLQLVVDLAVGYIENCDGATLMVRRGGEIVTPAFSDLDTRAADRAQNDTGEGPCLTAMEEHQTVIIEDMETERRWPDWRERLSDLGFRSMAGLRLFIAQDTMGALNLYSRRPDAFPPHSQALAQVFASHAAVAMKAAIAEAGLERALVSRDIIGQAKGILMERERLSGQQAFERLSELSRRQNRKLRDLAQDIADTGEVPD